MRLNGLRAQIGYKRRWIRSGEPGQVAPNRLNQEFSVESPNQAWVGDITYIRTYEGFLYLAIVIDLFSRRVVGWSMQPTMSRDLVMQALLSALWRRRCGVGDRLGRFLFTAIREASMGVRTISRS